jgi:L-fuconolactonase
MNIAMNILDAHHHLWRYTPEDYGWISSEMAALQRDFLVSDLEQETRAAGVSGSIVVQATQSLDETRWLLELADASALIRGVVGWAPISSPEITLVLAELSGWAKLKGLRHVIQDEPDENFILREDFNAGIDALEGTGLVYDMLIREQHLPQAAAFVRRHPRQVFVLDHLAKPKIREKIMQPWRDNLARLAENGNVYCKLSGMVTEANWASWSSDDLYPYLDEALRVFGAERLMAGSDWPVCLVAASYEQWWKTIKAWTSSLTVEHQRQVLGATACRVYHL